MIPRSAGIRQTPPWQQELAEAITSPRELAEHLGLAPDSLPETRLAAEIFPLRVPKSYLDKIKPGDPRDPLLLQILPQSEEMSVQPGYTQDPVGDLDAVMASGVLHKYRGRVLINTTQACAIHCRYCFRRSFPYADVGHGPQAWGETLDYLRQRPQVDEVILSGGDPLSLTTGRLSRLLEALSTLDHITTIRLHTRYPLVLPSRIDAELLSLLSLLSGQRFKIVLVAHANHPNELDEVTAHAFGRLTEARVTLLNQSVLLRGINDSVDCLEQLSRRLFEQGVLPYYLHCLDKVQGAAHFDTGPELARRIHRDLRARLPGYLVPRLVQEIAGEPNKTPLD